MNIIGPYHAYRSISTIIAVGLFAAFAIPLLIVGLFPSPLPNWTF